MKKCSLLAIGVIICLSALILPAAFAADAVKPAAKAKVDAPAAAQPAKTDFSVLDGKTGTVNYSIWSEAKVTALMNQALGTKVKNFVFTDSMTDALAMIKSGRADFMMTSDLTADYIIQRNPDMKYINFPSQNSLAMILRIDEAPLRDSINAAIAKMQASGKLAELFKKWVTDLPVGHEPGMPKIEKTNYPETVYVGVTGDIPPLDYVSVDGKPAGYNIAVLAEVAKLIGKNIEAVTVAPQAKLAALQSKKIDVFFWQRIPSKKGQEMISKDPDVLAFNKKFLLTEPYVLIKTALLMKK